MQNDRSCTITNLGRPALRATYPDEKAMPDTIVMMSEGTFSVRTSAQKRFSPRTVENAVAPRKYSRSHALTFSRGSFERSCFRYRTTVNARSATMIAATTLNQKKIGMPVADQQNSGTITPTMLEM